ncbi:MAG: twin-arginine translocation signal domain-containing protein [Planctomycetota bacterium]
MSKYVSKQQTKADSTRRQFLKRYGLGAMAGAMANGRGNGDTAIGRCTFSGYSG